MSDTATANPQAPIVDLIFEIEGTTVPQDHGYLLFTAIADLVDNDTRWFHETREVGLVLITGPSNGKSDIVLNQTSTFGLRIPERMLGKFMPLAGKTLAVGGGNILIRGIQTPRPIAPANIVYSPIVTYKNATTQDESLDHVRAQLVELEIPCRVRIGKYRRLQIKGMNIAGFALAIGDFCNPDDSVKIQAIGLGGRRKMGCGVFLPASRWMG